MDGKLIEMVNEDDMDGEVEQADVVREKTGTCIMDIDQALESAGIRGVANAGDGSPSHITRPF